MPTASDASIPPPSQSGTAEDELVQRARREIAEIVREVSRLARQPLDRDLFFASMIDHTVCAIAAEGAVVWDCRKGSIVAVVRTGRVTDASIPAAALATHEKLLQEIAGSGVPTVVPSTPDAIDPNLPSNPSGFPVAVVPIADLAESDPTDPGKSGRFVLEVFLESDAGVATQRGYLRFVTQMADLASEFLRSHEMRLSRRRERLQSQLMESLNQLHQSATAAAVAAAIVDGTAEWFGVSRASLIVLGEGRPRLLAVSHVESIDHRGQGSRQLIDQMKSLEFPAGACLITALTEDATQSAGGPRDAVLHGYAATRDARDRLRLYLQDGSRRQPDALMQSVLEDWSRQSLAILATRLQLESIPLAKVYLAVTLKIVSVSPSRLRRWVTTLGALAAFSLIAWIPTPLVVTMPATLRPEGTRVHYAPTDAVVETVEVKHGQLVQRGDVLMRLRDWALEEQMTTLIARRGVISQRLTRSIASLVEGPGLGPSPIPSRTSLSDDDLVQQQRLLEEEIAGLDEQIALAEEARDRLTIRAQLTGRIDGWQTELTASGRPVRRGDSLLRIEPLEARWMADARIAQARVGVVLERLEQDPQTIVKVATVAQPDRVYKATFARRQTVMGSGQADASPPDDLGGERALGIELAIHLDAADSEDVRSAMWTNGAPATVTIDCAKRPLMQVLFFDLEREWRRAWARWI